VDPEVRKGIASDVCTNALVVALIGGQQSSIAGAMKLFFVQFWIFSIRVRMLH